MRESYTKHFDSRSNRAVRTLNDLTRGMVTKEGTYYTRGGGRRDDTPSRGLSRRSLSVKLPILISVTLVCILLIRLELKHVSKNIPLG